MRSRSSIVSKASAKEAREHYLESQRIIDDLVRQGRDPLDAVSLSIDDRLAHYLSEMPIDLKTRLMELIDNRVKSGKYYNVNETP